MSFECRGLFKTFRSRNGGVTALEDVTFSAGEAELICIVGPSGCGKTTLLRLIAGLLEPDGGELRFKVSGSRSQPLTALVFQDHGVFPWMNVLDNVAFGLEMRGVPAGERHRRALDFIGRVGLAEFARSYPHQLSVGMRQRVGIARAFLSNPRILLMDEPFGSLDAQTRRVLQEELLALWKSAPKTVVYVTHDIEEAVLLGDRVLVMSGRPGRILEDIPVPLGRPRNHEVEAIPAVVELRKHIWGMLERQVKSGLGLES